MKSLVGPGILKENFRMAATEVDALFKPTSASVRQLLSDLVGGFAIPSYQRPYRWKPADLRRMCDDLISAMDRLVDDDEDAVSFIGAIITVSGVSEEHHTLPADARRIIDGQQRLTTILMIAIAAHEKLGELIDEVGRSAEIDEETRDWVNDQVSEARYQLLGCLGDIKAHGDEEYRVLPKIIRELSDRWSVKKSTAKYCSPIANLLHSYLNHRNNSRFRLIPPEISSQAAGSSEEDFEVFGRRFQQVRDAIRDVADGREGDLASYIDLESILRPRLLEGLFKGTGQSGELSVALRAASAKNEVLARCLRLLFFSRFLLDRMALTQINAVDEVYAFELFDSLNTTGEPLTAFETFVPLVTQEEGLDSYPVSPSYRDMSITNKVLGGPEDVQGRTARLITRFLLAEAGLKIPNKHNAQRRALSQRYKSADNIEQRRAMTRQLATSALCHKYLWQEGVLSDRSMGPRVELLSDETRFALGFLNKINHGVVEAPLSRYYGAWLQEPSDKAKKEIEDAVKVFAAFSALWRAAHGGTDGIDSVYRKIMQSGVGDIFSPLARTSGITSHTENELPSIVDVAQGMRHLLGNSKTNRFSTCEEWIALSAERPIYDEQEQLAKFLLLLAGHGAIADGDTGLTKDGNLSDNINLLRDERHTSDDRLATLEHVAPQTFEGKGWSTGLYSTGALVHSLGNLTLLPIDDNSFVSNRSWAHKRILYRVLSARDPEEAEQILNSAKDMGLQLAPDRVRYLLARRQHLPFLEAIARYEGEWDENFVRMRSRHLLERAWRILDRWLSPSMQ